MKSAENKMETLYREHKSKKGMLIEHATRHMFKTVIGIGVTEATVILGKELGVPTPVVLGTMGVLVVEMGRQVVKIARDMRDIGRENVLFERSRQEASSK